MSYHTNATQAGSIVLRVSSQSIFKIKKRPR